MAKATAKASSLLWYDAPVGSVAPARAGPRALVGERGAAVRNALRVAWVTAERLPDGFTWRVNLAVRLMPTLPRARTVAVLSATLTRIFAGVSIRDLTPVRFFSLRHAAAGNELVGFPAAPSSPNTLALPRAFYVLAAAHPVAINVQVRGGCRGGCRGRRRRRGRAAGFRHACAVLHPAVTTAPAGARTVIWAARSTRGGRPPVSTAQPWIKTNQN